MRALFDFFGKHVCDESCLYASKERCVCHCKGKHHQSRTVTPESTTYRRLDRFLQLKPVEQEFGLHTVIEGENIIHELTREWSGPLPNYFFQFKRNKELVLWMSPWFFLTEDFSRNLDKLISERTNSFSDSWAESHGNRIWFPIDEDYIKL